MAKRDPSNGGKYFGPSGFDPSSGKWGAAVSTPEEVEFHARNERERHGLHLSSLTKTALPLLSWPGYHTSCCHGSSPGSWRDSFEYGALVEIGHDCQLGEPPSIPAARPAIFV